MQKVKVTYLGNCLHLIMMAHIQSVNYDDPITIIYFRTFPCMQKSEQVQIYKKTVVLKTRHSAIPSLLN